MPADETLADACVAERRIYLLFPASLRINFLSQQVRALELVDALGGQDWMAGVNSVAIVGGGASGVTAAAALKSVGLREDLAVTLFESRDQLMPLQSGCHDKLLAPHIIDWPSAGAEDPIARLPVLGWRKGVAGGVAIEVLEQFERFDVRSELGAVVTRVQHSANGTIVEFERGGVREQRPFDLAIIAAGFGLESEPIGIANQTQSYWRVNPRQAPALRGHAPKRILISGLGDGGLIDFVLFACPGLSHERLCAQLLSSADVAPLMAEIEEIERQSWEHPSPMGDIAAAYEALNLDAAARSLILPWLTSNTEFALLTRGSELFHRGTSPLNRLAARLVIRATELEDRGTRVRVILNALHLADRGGESAWSVGGVEHAERFDEVVTRHGDTSARTWDFGNAAIDAKVAALRAKRAGLRERPRTPRLEPEIAARFECRLLRAHATRIRLTRVAGGIAWHSDLAVNEIGRLWRVPSAPIHIEIEFGPLGGNAALDLAICRLLSHAEPLAEIAGPSAVAWIDLMHSIGARAGDRTRPAAQRMGRVVVDRNETQAEADQLARVIEASLDRGLLALFDDTIERIIRHPHVCPVRLHPEVLGLATAAWAQWVGEAEAMSSSNLRWVLELLGGLLDGHGRPDPWNSIRVGPRCLQDELMPAILYHLAMRSLLDGFAGPGGKPTGNVLCRGEDGGSATPAHICGSRWYRDGGGEASDINDWEKSWPGDRFAPSCLVLPARTADFLPPVTITMRNTSTGMVAQPWDRVPVVFGSAELRHALRTGAAEAKSAFKSALTRALPEI